MSKQKGNDTYKYKCTCNDLNKNCNHLHHYNENNDRNIINILEKSLDQYYKKKGSSNTNNKGNKCNILCSIKKWM